MNVVEARELLNKFECVEDWQVKYCKDEQVFCIDMTIKNKGWVRIYNRCNGNLNSNADIYVEEINEQTVSSILNDYKNIKLKWE